MDDIRQDDLPEQPPAPAGVARTPGLRQVGPESETRGGPEALDEVLPDTWDQGVCNRCRGC